MTDQIDHYKSAEMAREEAMQRGFFGAWRWFHKAQVHATLALVEQQRIANRLEYARLAIEQYGNYAPTGANLSGLFALPETEHGNMRVPEDIAAALWIKEEPPNVQD